MLYGSADIKKLVKKAKECNQQAIALTDYSNLFNAVNFYKEATHVGIKPILGVDVLFCEDCDEYKEQKIRQTNHLVLLAENDIGWKNITRIVAESNTGDNFYFSPRIDFKILEKYSDGIIALAGGTFDGVISYYLYDKKGDDGSIRDSAAPFKAQALVRRFIKIFGTDRFFLEVQDHGHDIQREVNNKLRNIAIKYGIKTVATNNVHYVDKSDAEAHKTLLSMNVDRYNRTTSTDFSREEYYLKSREEMCLHDSEIATAVEIGERCNVLIDVAKRRLPKYAFLPEGETADGYLRKLVMDGLAYIIQGKKNADDYMARVERELSDIHEMGFDDYFLIVHDVISWCQKEKMLIGRGRGSAGGSLVSYCLGITDIDPLKYGLIWERFLNKGRGGLPDIDSDVPQSKRKAVIDYIKSRFGANNVAQIVNYNAMKAKGILKEVFRVYGMEFEEANRITALIPNKNEDHVDISLDEALATVPALREYEKKYKAWFSIARSLEGCYKATGIHAAGIVISDTPFEESSYPLARAKDGTLIFGWDMQTVDTLSLLKLDILGLTTLDDVQTTFDLVKNRRGLDVTRQSIPLNDSSTYAMIGAGFTVGVFQIEKQLGQVWSKNLEPSNIEEISDLCSIIRPGPLDSGMAEQYQEVKAGRTDPDYIHNKLEPILSKTYSGCLYQEQVIEICRQLSGMSSIDADKVRKAMGKKKPEEMAKWKKIFIDGCYNYSNIDIITAEQIWSFIETFAGYGFNKSHGVGYGLLTYETAYLKTNYTVEFLCAKLRHTDGDFDKISALVYDGKLFNINVVPPSVKNGNSNFAIIDDNNIAFGLTSVKGVGIAAITDIKTVANNVSNFDDILWKIKLTKNKITSAVVAALIKSGAFDSYGEPRVRMLAKHNLMEGLSKTELKNIDSLMKREPDIKDWVRFVRGLSDDSKTDIIKNKYGIRVPDARRRPKLQELLREYDAADLFDGKIQNIGWEKQYLGISLSGNEAEMFNARNKCAELMRSGEPNDGFEIAVCVDSAREHICGNGKTMAFVSARDDTYAMNNIVVFPQQFEKFHDLLIEGNILKISGKISDRRSLVANKIKRLR
jgi:DNA polymerase-3 subunit alpha